MAAQALQTSPAGDPALSEAPVASGSFIALSREASVPEVESWIVRALVIMPRWMLLAVLVVAPWAYGCSRDWTLTILQSVLFAIVGLWLAGCIMRRTPPILPLALWLPALLLLVQGWWMTLNSGWVYDATFQPQARDAWSSSFPGSVNYADSLPAMTRISAMLGLACFAADLLRRPEWRRRVWLTMALAGVSIVILGLAQKVTQAPGIFWRAEGHGATFFGPYRYHANAGAYINLVWPLVGAFFVQAVRRSESRAVQILWGASLALCVTGALANTSRASGFIAIAFLVSWGLLACWRMWRQRQGGTNPAAAVGLVLLLLIMAFGVVAFGGFETAWRRWKAVDQEFTATNSRLLGAQACLAMLPQAGWWGLGPGTFPTAFPFFNRDTSEATRGVWLQAHQDYLQTLAEWGRAGGALWALLLPGAWMLGAWRLARGRMERSSDRVFLAATLAALASVLLHACVDFPLQIASIQVYVAVMAGGIWSGSAGSGAAALESRRFRRKTGGIPA